MPKQTATALDAEFGIEDFDVVDYLESPQEIAAYLKACMKEAPNDPNFISAALGDVVRASKRMSQLSRETGISREGLSKALKTGGNPSLVTLTKVLDSLGLELMVRVRSKPISTERARPNNRKAEMVSA